jgi:RND family efflux transporter MFP subunit
MNSRNATTLHLPTVENSQRTLTVAKVAGISLLVFFLLAGVWRAGVNQVEAKNLEQRNVASLTRSVIGVHTKPGEASSKLVLPASLRGNTETQIYARTNGYLSAWYKTIGDQVKKGDVLAVIDVPELEQELAQAHAAIAQIKVRLEFAKTTLKRWTLLKDTDSVILQEYDEKRNAVLQAEADLAAAEVNAKRLEKVEGYRRIVAPFSGVITRRVLDVGSLITTGAQELFALTQTDPLRLTVWVPQVYAEYVKVGQEVAVRQIESHDRPVIAHIDHVAGALDPVNRSRQVDIILKNSDGGLLPGSYVEVAIKVIGKVSPIVAPVNVLVVNQAGTHVVTVDAEHRVAFRPVTLGRDYGREIEILEGIKPDDLLVASPSDLLVEGETVTVVEPKEKQKNASGNIKS